MTNKFLSRVKEGENTKALYGVTVLLVVLAYFIGQAPFGLGTYITAMSIGKLSLEDYQDAIYHMDMDLLMMDKNLGLFLLLLMFVFAFVALWFGVTKLHKRKFLSLANAQSKLNWNKIFFSFFLWIIIGVIAECLVYSFQPENYQYTFNLWSFLPLLLICIFILPIQTSFEEFFFRGYLLQGFSLLTEKLNLPKGLNSYFIPLIITSLLFGLVHGSNPEVEKYGFWIMQANYVGAALFLGILVIMDEGLELALGAHAATNFYGACFVGYEASAIQTDSIFKLNNINPSLSLGIFVISGIVFVLICSRKYNWPSFTHLFSEINLETSENESFEKIADNIIQRD